MLDIERMLFGATNSYLNQKLDYFQPRNHHGFITDITFRIISLQIDILMCLTFLTNYYRGYGAPALCCDIISYLNLKSDYFPLRKYTDFIHDITLVAYRKKILTLFRHFGGG